MIDASSAKRRNGCMVTSQASSGVRQTVKKSWTLRTSCIHCWGGGGVCENNILKCNIYLKFRKIPASLSHHPHGNVVDRFTAGRSQEVVVCERREVLRTEFDNGFRDPFTAAWSVAFFLTSAFSAVADMVCSWFTAADSAGISGNSSSGSSGGMIREKKK